MLMNTSEEAFVTDIKIPCSQKDSFCLINPDNLETKDIQVQKANDGGLLEVNFASLSPVIICKY